MDQIVRQTDTQGLDEDGPRPASPGGLAELWADVVEALADLQLVGGPASGAQRPPRP